MSAESSPLAALTVAAIADELGDLDASIEPQLERRKALRGEMTRRRLRRAVGLRWIIDRAVKTPLVVDVPAIEARMGDTWMAPFRTKQTRTEFTASPCPTPSEDAA